jgi:hypothetical protein
MDKVITDERHPIRFAYEKKYDAVSIYLKEYAELIHWKYCPMVKKLEPRLTVKEHIRSRSEIS